MAPILDDVGLDDGDLVNLMNERVRVVPGQGMRTVAARVRLEGPNLIGRQERALGLGVPRLAAPAFARGRLGRCRFHVRCVGRGRFRGVGGVLVEPGFEFGNFDHEFGDRSLKNADIRHDLRRQVIGEVRRLRNKRHGVRSITEHVRPWQPHGEGVQKALENARANPCERLPGVLDVYTQTVRNRLSLTPAGLRRPFAGGSANLKLEI